MYKKHTIKKYIWAVLGITFLFSLLCIIRFIINIDPAWIDHPKHLIKLPILHKIFLISYTTFFLFICVTTSLGILLIFHKIAPIFLKIRITLREYILLFWILIVLLFVSRVRPRLISIPQLSNVLLLVLLYLLAAIIILFIYYWLHKTKEFIRSTICAFLALTLSGYLYISLDAKFASPLTKENFFLGVIILMASGLTAVLCYYFFHKMSFPLYQVYYERAYLKGLIILYISVSIGISIFGFLWENKKTTLDYLHVTSQTKKDINVILIVIDALRADHLGCYDYGRKTSPNIDTFAKEGVLFKHCYAQASWTKPSVASLFSSLYPTMHQTTLHKDTLPDELTTLAEVLHKEGYINYGYIANPNLKSIFNFNQGFDFFDDYLMRDKCYYVSLRSIPHLKIILQKATGKMLDFSDRDNIRLANKRIIPWLERYKDENFFMYLHYMDPHWPYSPPRPYKKIFPYVKGKEFSKAMSLYDGEILFVDEYIGKLFDKLKSLGIYDKTLIIITSDHGQAFGEHGDYHHGFTIYQHQLWIPLIIKFPESMPKRKICEFEVSSIDIMPTILDILNISYDGSLEGTSLLPLLGSKEGRSLDGNIFIEENFDNRYILKGIIKNNTWKYIFTEKSELRDVKNLGQEELYNLIDDPSELNNLIEREVEVSKILRDKLVFYIRYCEERAVYPSKKNLDSETIRQLKSLGYIH